MADERIELEVVLNDGSIKKVFANIKKDGKETADSLEKGFGSSLISSFTGVKAAIASAVAIAGGGLAFRSIVNAGLESEKAWRGFAAALASTGQLSRTSLSNFEELASGLQKVTGIQDEVIASGAALLVNVGRLSTEALPKATKAALDLSAALQIGPEQAFSLVSKAATGNTDALSRYGIKIDEAIPKGERFAAVLKLIETNFGGQAAAAAQTFQGALARLTNGFSDIQENIGRLITSSPAAIAVLNKLADLVGGFAERISGFSGGRDPLRPLILGALNFGEAFVTFVVQPLEMGVNAAKFFVNAMMEGIQTVIVVVARLAQGISIVLDAVGLGLNNTLKTNIENFASSSSEVLTQFAEQTTASFEQIGQTGFTDSLEGFRASLASAVTESADSSSRIAENLRNGAASVGESFDQMKKKADQFQQALHGALVQGVSSSIQAMTKSLILGKGGWESFGKAILGIVGDMAIQIGTFAIAQGILMTALASNPFTAGSAAIVAGAALIAIGTVLKSFSGNEGGIGSTGGLSGGTTTPTDTSPTQDNTDELRTQQQTAVTINVEGNILDRRETGLAIAEIIQESFDINGTRLVTGAV